MNKGSSKGSLLKARRRSSLWIKETGQPKRRKTRRKPKENRTLPSKKRRTDEKTRSEQRRGWKKHRIRNRLPKRSNRMKKDGRRPK